jgi:hypothetical protein
MKTYTIQGVECEAIPYLCNKSSAWFRQLAGELGYSSSLCALCPNRDYGEKESDLFTCIEVCPANCTFVPVALAPLFKLRRLP